MQTNNAIMLPGNAADIAFAMESFGYYDLADTIRTGISPLGRALTQKEYDDYWDEATQIIIEEA